MAKLLRPVEHGEIANDSQVTTTWALRTRSDPLAAQLGSSSLRPYRATPFSGFRHRLCPNIERKRRHRIFPHTAKGLAVPISGNIVQRRVGGRVPRLKRQRKKQRATALRRSVCLQTGSRFGRIYGYESGPAPA